MLGIKQLIIVKVVMGKDPGVIVRAKHVGGRGVL